MHQNAPLPDTLPQTPLHSAFPFLFIYDSDNADIWISINPESGFEYQITSGQGNWSWRGPEHLASVKVCCLSVQSNYHS